jgi:hypothetical protein
MQRCDAFCPYLTFVYGIATTSRTKLFVWAIWGSGGVVVGGGVVGGGGGPEEGGVVGICTDRLVSVVCMLDNMRIPRSVPPPPPRAPHAQRTLQAPGPEYVGESARALGTQARPALPCRCKTLSPSSPGT